MTQVWPTGAATGQFQSRAKVTIGSFVSWVANSRCGAPPFSPLPRRSMDTVVRHRLCGPAPAILLRAGLRDTISPASSKSNK